MADRVRLGDGTELDMLDPLSIRAYCRRTLAMLTEPTHAQLGRLEMLEAHAAKLEAAAGSVAHKPVITLADARAASAELLRLKSG